MYQVLKNKKGFTLIEFVVYTGLLALIILFLMQFILGIILANATGKAQEALITNAAQAADLISLETRHATEIYTPTSDFISDPGQISLTTKRDLPQDEETTYVDFYVSPDERLCMKKETLGVYCITSADVRVESLQFTRLAPDDAPESVRVQLVLEYISPRPELRIRHAIQTTIGLRSYAE